MSNVETKTATTTPMTNLKPTGVDDIKNMQVGSEAIVTTSFDKARPVTVKKINRTQIVTTNPEPWKGDLRFSLTSQWNYSSGGKLVEIRGIGQDNDWRLVPQTAANIAKVEKSYADDARRAEAKKIEDEKKAAAAKVREAFLASPEGLALTAAQKYFEGCELTVTDMYSRNTRRGVTVKLVYKAETVFSIDVRQDAESSYDDKVKRLYPSGRERWCSFMGAPEISSYSLSGDFRRFKNAQPAVDKAVEIAETWNKVTGREVDLETTDEQNILTLFPAQPTPLQERIEKLAGAGAELAKMVADAE
jgi:hypothetical protein